MSIIEILQQDYQNFPHHQTYSIYADDVYFQDPLNRFRGVQRYRDMIGFLGNFFTDIDLELHHIVREVDQITTEWTLKMTSPLPWKPRLVIPGWSQLQLNQDQLIISHIDYWHISPWEVVKQNFFVVNKSHNNNK